MREQPLQKLNELLEVLPPIRDELENFANTLQRVADVAQAFFNADISGIIGINPITKTFITPFMVAGNTHSKDTAHYEQMISQEMLQQSNSVLFFESVADVPEHQYSLTKLEHIHSFVVLVFSTKKRQGPLGVLYLYFKQQQQFSSHKRELFQLFIKQVCFLLQEAWLLKRYQAVAQVGKEINQQLDSVESLVQKLKQHIGDILDIRHAFLLADYQPQTNSIDVYLEEEGHAVRVSDKPLTGACRYVIEKQQTLFINHYSQETLPFEIDFITGTGREEAFIYVPLVFRDVPLGVLSIQHLQPDSYDQEELSILELLANHVALALQVEPH